MERDQREIITKQQLAKSFANAHIGAMIGLSVMFIPFLLLLLFFSFMIEQTAAFYVWGVVFLFYLLSLMYNFLEYRKNKRGAFLFVRDKLEGIAEDERLVKRGRTTYLESAFYFADHGRVVVGRGAIRLSSCGDEFFLVIRSGCKRSVLAFYNMKYYRPEKLDG